MNIFTYIAYALLGLVLFANVANAKVTRLSAIDRAALEQGSTHPKMVYLMKDVPAAILEACTFDTSGHGCEFADPGEQIQTTDQKEGLPERRLIWGSHVPGYYVLHYEAGGKQSSYHIMVITYGQNSDTKVIWRGISDAPLTDYSDFLSALTADKLDDSLNYSY